MIFKKKKKEEQEVTNPFNESVMENMEQVVIEPLGESEVEPVEEVANFESPIVEEVNEQVVELNQVVNQPYEDTINNGIDEDASVLNQINPASLEMVGSNSEELDFKTMEVDDLIQDVVEEYCPNCGSKLEENAGVCFLCGTTIK